MDRSADTALPGTDRGPEAGPAADGRAARSDRRPAGGDQPDLSEGVGAAQQGDERAFRVLYRDMQPRLLRYLRAMVGEDAEDVASEAWLHIARDLAGFSGDSDGFRGRGAPTARHGEMHPQRRHRRRPETARAPVEGVADLAGGDDTAQNAMDTV